MDAKIYKSLFFSILAVVSLDIDAQLKINSGTHFINTGTMVIESHYINDGNFTNSAGANVVFKGATQQFMQGNGTSNFYGLQINKSSGDILLQTNITVAGGLQFTKGSLDLTYNSLQLLYPNGLLQNETEQNRIFSTGNGVAFIELPLNAPNNTNPGNLGFSITSQDNLGSTVVYRGHDQQSKSNGDKSMSRYYHVQPANNQNIYANYVFRYFDAELNGHPENAQQLHQKVGAADWQVVGINGFNTQSNFIQVLGATSFNKYTLFPFAQAPLPLQLLAFTAQCKNNNVLLQWITANEVATKDFTVEKSRDGVSWQPAGVVGAQQSTARQTYTFTAALDNSVFFRLKFRDADGSFHFSPVRMLDCDARNQITVGPNPTTGQIKIAMQAAKRDNVMLTVRDAKGRTLLHQNVALAEGLNVHLVDLSAKPTGVYLIILWSANGINETHRIVKQ